TPELPQVMHLWFLVNLAIYTLLCWPLLVLRGRLEALHVRPLHLVAVLAAGVTVIAVLIKPHGAAIAGDGYQFPWYLGLFAAGIVLGAQHRRVLDWAARRWGALLAAGLVGFAVEVGTLGAALARDPEYGAALAAGGWAAAGLGPAYTGGSVVFMVAEGLNAWLFALTAFGLCARYLNRPSRLLGELARATYPIYVLHFPVTIIGLALLATVPWPWGWEFLLLTVAVYGVTVALYVLADRSPFPSYLIGGRAAGAGPQIPSRK
ncbi:MAG: acyltransferase family protein, partial [Pseudomonadota bacterium]